MNQHLNYEDNIFILNVNIRTIADLMQLDADPDIFLEKTIEDLNFIAAKLNLLYESLSINKHLISRNEQMHNLDETYERFLELLNGMARGTGCFSAANYPSIREPVNTLIAHCVNCQKLIKSAMRDSDTNTISHQFVSADELSALLDRM
jgi:hypothetical protein